MAQTAVPFRRNRPLQGMLAWLLLYWTITAINRFNRQGWLLENIPVLVYTNIAVLVSHELGDAYLGTLGDISDAQKDMELALLGATLSIAITVMRERGRCRTESP